MQHPIHLPQIQAAHERIRPWIHRTPVLHSATIDRWLGCEVYFKCENFQRAGAFKYRGATNAVLQLDAAQRASGVATHSSGNHAGALARAARQHGLSAYIVMPRNAPAAKRQAVEEYGGQIVFCEPTLEAREQSLAEVVARTGAHFIHPYNNYHVICGQGTAALELIEQQPGLQLIMAPVGGGGLLSGTAVAAKGLDAQMRVWGAEPELANDAYLSLQTGQWHPASNAPTLADGLRTALGPITFDLVQQHVDRIITCSEADIVRAMRILWERMKIVVEPSSAVPLAALMANGIPEGTQRIGLIVSGGNVDLGQLPFA